MASFSDVFERKEVKYVLSSTQYEWVVGMLERRGRMAPDSYGKGRVTSMYLDTPTRSMINRSLEKPLYKEKLRVRWYDRLSAGSPVFIEVKKKFKGIVYKRRVACSYEAARAYFAGVPYREACLRFPLANEDQAADSVSPRSLQTAQEINQVIKRYAPLSPSMVTTCIRTAYAPECVETVQGSCATTLEANGASGTVHSSSASPSVNVAAPDPVDVRVTFDENVAYRDLMSAESNGAHALFPLLPKGSVIMEVKVPGAFPLWLSHSLARCGAYPSSFSKYGAAYKACERNRRSA